MTRTPLPSTSGMIDLDQYDYTPGSGALIRATEGTVLSRIPPRVKVRQDAPIELPHARPRDYSRGGHIFIIRQTGSLATRYIAVLYFILARCCFKTFVNSFLPIPIDIRHTASQL